MLDVYEMVRNAPKPSRDWFRIILQGTLLAIWIIYAMLGAAIYLRWL